MNKSSFLTHFNTCQQISTHFNTFQQISTNFNMTQFQHKTQFQHEYLQLLASRAPLVATLLTIRFPRSAMVVGGWIPQHSTFYPTWFAPAFNTYFNTCQQISTHINKFQQISTNFNKFQHDSKAGDSLRLWALIGGPSRVKKKLRETGNIICCSAVPPLLWKSYYCLW